MPSREKERPRVYLDNVHFGGFKSINDLEIDIQKGLNILIGKNGAGKSNFLELINQVTSLKITSKVLYKFAHLEFVSDDNHSFIFDTERELHTKIVNEYLSDRIGLSERFIKDGDIIYDDGVYIKTGDKQLTYTINPANFFSIWTQRNIDPSYIRFSIPENLGCIDLPGTIKADVDGIIYWEFPESLSFMNKVFSDLERYFDDFATGNIEYIKKHNVLESLVIEDAIIENLKRVTSIEDVRFNKNVNFYYDEKSVIIENIKIDFKINGNWLPWSQLSDGTRRLFYIISEVTYNKGIVLIEEPELGIHPHQFHLLMTFLKEQSEDKQIILSTHAPKALDHLSPDELDSILIAYYDSKKGTQIRHLTKKEEQKAERYMKEVGFFSDYWMHSDLE